MHMQLDALSQEFQKAVQEMHQHNARRVVPCASAERLGVSRR